MEAPHKVDVSRLPYAIKRRGPLSDDSTMTNVIDAHGAMVATNMLTYAARDLVEMSIIALEIARREGLRNVQRRGDDLSSREPPPKPPEEAAEEIEPVRLSLVPFDLDVLKVIGINPDLSAKQYVEQQLVSLSQGQLHNSLRRLRSNDLVKSRVVGSKGSLRWSPTDTPAPESVPDRPLRTQLRNCETLTDADRAVLRVLDGGGVLSSQDIIVRLTVGMTYGQVYSILRKLRRLEFISSKSSDSVDYDNKLFWSIRQKEAA